MEAECLICGGWTFQEISQYNVYLKESKKCVGVLCKDCYKKYQEREEKQYYLNIS